MKLKMIGNYKEIPNGKKNLKSIKDFTMQEKYVFQDKILNYLKTIARAINNLKNMHIINRVGANKNGSWEIIK